MRVTVLGAGAMGSAFAAMVARGEHEAVLWGTHLDRDIVHQLRAGRPHPRTHVGLPAAVSVVDETEPTEAVTGAELIVLAVSSDGALPVTAAALPAISQDAAALLILTKGFAVSPSDQVELLSDAVARILSSRPTGPPVVVVGGPCKANEVAAGRTTYSVFASDRAGVAADIAGMVSTEDYIAIAGDDVAGVEVVAALKNLYAVALGVCDGLAVEGGQPWHDLRAGVFTQAISEMSWIVTSLGGRLETVVGLSGVGDLDVTGQSGRNRAFGERLGRGENVQAAHAAMASVGLTVEGLAVAGLARRLVLERLGEADFQNLPLLVLLTSVLTRDEGVFDGPSELVAAVSAGLQHSYASSDSQIIDGGQAAVKGGDIDTDS